MAKGASLARLFRITACLVGGLLSVGAIYWWVTMGAFGGFLGDVAEASGGSKSPSWQVWLQLGLYAFPVLLIGLSLIFWGIKGARRDP